MIEEADKRFTVEEVDGVTPPPRARVEDVDDAEETPGAKLERKKDYLEGFLAQQPAAVSPAEPGGELYERVIEALREIYDPEIPVNIYDLGLIYGVDVTEEADVAITVAPSIFPMSTAAMPTPPVLPWTSSVSPAFRLPRMTSPT